MVAREQEKLYTAEEFWKIARLPENEGKRLELDEGEIVEFELSSPLNSITAGRVAYFLNIHVMPQNLGYITGPDGGFKLAPKTVRQPDAAFISKTRAPKIPREFEIAPDLAVEIVSPHEDVWKKANEYLRAGTKLVWAVYPTDKIVYVFRLNDDGSLRGQPFDINATLDGGDVLPGFTLALRDIFPE
jgi:Uma2 family endonuclease